MPLLVVDPMLPRGTFEVSTYDKVCSTDCTAVCVKIDL